MQYGIQLAVIRLTTVSVQKLIDLFKDDPLPPISLRPEIETPRTSTPKGRQKRTIRFLGSLNTYWKYWQSQIESR
jgi:hypothetical protein